MAYCSRSQPLEWQSIEVDGALVAYLDEHAPVAQDCVTWPNGLTFDFTAYLLAEPPPIDLVVSVRAILERDGQILVFDTGRGETHIVPGGQRLPGETLIETLQREIGEETGCCLAPAPQQLGVIHLHLRSPRPEGSPYPYPDSLWLIYAARALPGGKLVSGDDWVRDPRFVGPDDIAHLPISPVERAFLRASALSA